MLGAKPIWVDKDSSNLVRRPERQMVGAYISTTEQQGCIRCGLVLGEFDLGCLVGIE